MSIQLVITNEKGFFAHGQCLVLVTHEQLQHIRTLSETYPSHGFLKWGYEILSSFPFVHGKKVISLKSWRDRDTLDGVGFWHASQFTSKNDRELPALTGTQDGLGWSALRRFYENKAFLSKLIQYLEQHEIFLFPLTDGSTLRNFAKRSLTLHIEEQDTWKKLGESNCVLVFGKTRGNHWMPSQEGYLDSRGMFGELRGARLFESVGAAERTIASSTSLRLECYVLVNASVQIQTIDESQLRHIGQLPNSKKPLHC